MQYPSIQWSPHSSKAKGIGRTVSVEGKPVESTMGYIRQALTIAWNPKDFSERDLLKAGRVLRSAKAKGRNYDGLARLIDEHLAERNAPKD